MTETKPVPQFTIGVMIGKQETKKGDRLQDEIEERRISKKQKHRNKKEE